MADLPASIDSVYRVTGLLDRLSLRHAFVGGIALNAWGIPRATFDLDLTLSISPAEFDSLVQEFRRDGIVVDPTFERGFRDRIAGMEMVHVHLPVGTSLMAVDVFLATTPFLESVLSRRVAIELGHGPIWVCTAADLILFKLLADRGKDRVDVQNVLLVQGIPDRDHLERWVDVLGVRERLAAALATPR